MNTELLKVVAQYEDLKLQASVAPNFQALKTIQGKVLGLNRLVTKFFLTDLMSIKSFEFISGFLSAGEIKIAQGCCVNISKDGHLEVTDSEGSVSLYNLLNAHEIIAFIEDTNEEDEALSRNEKLALELFLLEPVTLIKVNLGINL